MEAPGDGLLVTYIEFVIGIQSSNMLVQSYNNYCTCKFAVSTFTLE